MEGFESNFKMEEFIRNGEDEGNFLYGINFKSGNWSDPDSIPTVLGWFMISGSLEVAPEQFESDIHSKSVVFIDLNPGKIMLYVHFHRQDGK